MDLPAPDDRVFIMRSFAGLRAMQVCVLPEVPDEEILQVCNRENPQLGTIRWHTVVKDVKHAMECVVSPEAAPGPCQSRVGRLHKIVLCL
jgi:hypothetical protein